MKYRVREFHRATAAPESAPEVQRGRERMRLAEALLRDLGGVLLDGQPCVVTMSVGDWCLDGEDVPLPRLWHLEGHVVVEPLEG